MVQRDWPGQVPQPHVYGNFRCDLSARAERARTKRAKQRAERVGNDLHHLVRVRQLWCTLGHERGLKIDCHHLQGGPARKFRGLGLKSPDAWVVPLEHFRHMELHALGSRHELDYFMENGGIDPYVLAAALFAITNMGVLTMGRVLTAHQLQGSANLLGRKPRATP